MSALSYLSSRQITRWLVPVAAAAAVLGGGAAIGAITAAADPTLPPRSAADLLVDLQSARLDGLSGTVVQRCDLGLPALPGAGGSDLTSLLSGTHTLRVWYSGPDKARIALLGTLGETDVITNGSDLWIWSSKENTATHSTLPARDTEATPVPSPTASLPAFTPQQLADAALKALSPSTQVSTEGTVSIAGRDAYELVLAPKDPASLIGSIRLAVDSTEHLPLRVQVLARGATTPAIEVAFTQISFSRPPSDQFTFNPPPGATVQEGNLAEKARPGVSEATQSSQRPRIAMVGRGWTAVLVAALPDASTTPSGSPATQGVDQLKGLLKQLPTVSGGWGSGHLLSSDLLNILITDDGRILVGAVRPAQLYLAAADPAAKLAK